jgi:HD-GYP domain-containing protein (c-di-GMP phosphodiesterase class II)
MVALGNQLGLDGSRIREVGLAGLVHVIGKVRIDIELLNKRGQLSGDEVAELRRHPQYGHEILLGDGGAWISLISRRSGHNETICSSSGRIWPCTRTSWSPIPSQPASASTS